MQAKANIMIVDDSPDIREVVKVLLSAENYNVIEAENGQKALSVFNSDANIDLVILDIMMPVMSGYDVCEALRKITSVPILFLTAKSQQPDKKDAYLYGGDDYLVKPFSGDELVIKVNSLIRRYFVYKGKIDYELKKGEIKLNNLIIDTIGHNVYKDDEKISLTEKEFSILLYLVQNQGHSMSVRDIFETVWDEKYLPSSTNNVMVHILNLRKKIEDGQQGQMLIKTVWGKGYQID